MGEITVRPVRTGDGEGCARAWRDAGRHYAAIVPDVIKEPDDDGLVGWLEQAIAEGRDDHTHWLVAEHDGEVIGFVEATVVRPAASARWQIQRDLSRTRLRIDALVVAEAHRRRGAGAALMTAAERWGRDRGAEVAITDTNLQSTLSVPFYEDGMGYARQAVILRKSLEA